MTIRASRGARLLVAAALAWLGLAMYAQAAHATYSKITIVKINQGGDQNDQFTFDTSLTPSPSPTAFSIKAGESNRRTFQVECNAQSACTQKWGALTQAISERPATGYTLTGVVCRHTGSSNGWGSEPTGSSALDPDTSFDAATSNINFRLDWYEWTKCWVTNTRKTGTIKVTKVLSPASDSGKFNLLVGGQVKKADVGDGGTTGVLTVNTGAYSVAETAGTATSLADYGSSLVCKDTAHGNAVDNDGTVQVGYGDAWECVFTNTRKTGTIKVTKVLSPASDSGKFNLLVGGQVKKADVGDGGTTGVLTVNTGAYSVAETAGTATSLADYGSSLVCKDTAHGNAVDNDGTVQVGYGDAWECVFTNTRKTGTIKVTKVLSPASDSGKFNLLVGGQVKKADVGDGGTTGVLTVNTGAYSVAETAGTATSLADYGSSLVCKDTAHGNAVDNDGTVQVGYGDAWECVFTNTRKTGTIKVTKVLSPASDSGKFNLLVGGQVKKADVGDGGTTGVLTVNTGAYSVAETAGTATSLADYGSSLVCKDTAHGNAVDNDGTVQVGYGDAWECVFTNTRKTQPPPAVEPPTPTPPAAPKIRVSPARVQPGSAKLRGPSGCPRTGTVAATVSGRRIVKVTFYVDGKKVKTLTKANGKGGTWKLPLNIKRLAYGTHRVRATVQFAKSSQTKVKTLRFSFDRCHAAAAQPKFTG